VRLESRGYRPQLPALPHSWDFSTWPSSVFAGNGQRAKYLFRVHRSAMLAAGACARIGRTIVFIGEGYARFLRKGAVRIEGFEIAATKFHRDRET
jgi:hypothetical protein